PKPPSPRNNSSSPPPPAPSPSSPPSRNPSTDVSLPSLVTSPTPSTILAASILELTEWIAMHRRESREDGRWWMGGCWVGGVSWGVSGGRRLRDGWALGLGRLGRSWRRCRGGWGIC
ncbi:hypothetical protein HYFRA_00012339, partial [Hymenoscyphus fraxineus]